MPSLSDCLLCAACPVQVDRLALALSAAAVSSLPAACGFLGTQEAATPLALTCQGEADNVGGPSWQEVAGGKQLKSLSEVSGALRGGEEHADGLALYQPSHYQPPDAASGPWQKQGGRIYHLTSGFSLHMSPHRHQSFR